MAWMPLRLKMTIRSTLPSGLQTLYRTSCQTESTEMGQRFCWRLAKGGGCCSCGSGMRTHRGDGVQRVLDGQQQNLVPAGGVVCVGGSGDPLAGGEVEEGLLLGDAHRLTGSSRHAALGALHAVELHQSLTLERHHHHITAHRQHRCVRGGGASLRWKQVAPLFVL